MLSVVLVVLVRVRGDDFIGMESGMVVPKATFVLFGL